ncbi:hypothetical protein T484DRAFT_1886985, partial [Baffinella frigidus]
MESWERIVHAADVPKSPLRELLMGVVGGERVVLASSGRTRTISVARSHGAKRHASSPEQHTQAGIGIKFRPSDEGVCVVANLVNGGPAHEAGVLEGDVIREIDGVACIGTAVPEMIARIKGTPGSLVTITLEDTRMHLRGDPPPP